MFSCNKDDTKNQESTVVLDDRFIMVFEGVFEKDDSFLIFYTEKEGEVFSNFKTLKREISGKATNQKLIFTFPEGVKPISFKIDFSNKKNQNHVKFLSLEFLDNNNKLVIDKSNLETFFAFNKHMRFEKQEGLLIGDVFIMDNKDAYNPYMVSKPKFNEALKKLHKASLNKVTKSLINDLVNIKLNDGRYRFIITGIFEKNDLITLYFRENTVDKFNSVNTLSLNAKGNLNEQTLIFTLPNGSSAVKFRLDISNTNKQTRVEIKKIQICKGSSSIIIKKENLETYFYPNNYISLDSNSGDFICKTIIENSLETYNPYFVSTPKMIEELLEF